MEFIFYSFGNSIFLVFDRQKENGATLAAPVYVGIFLMSVREVHME